MIEQLSVQQQVDQAVNAYVEAHGPTWSSPLVYREGVVKGVAIGLSMFQRYLDLNAQPHSTQREKESEKS